MPKQRVNDVEFEYTLLGRKTSLPPVVFVVGYAMTKDYLMPLATELQDNRQVLVFENQGIDATNDAGTPLTIDLMAENIMQLIVSLGLNNIILIGFAMGSNIAQKIAHGYPHLLRHLVLIASVLTLNDDARSTCERFCVLRESGDLNGYAKLLYDTIFTDDVKSVLSLADFSKQLIPSLDSQSIRNQRRQLEVFKSFDSRTWASKISTPTTVLAPEKDYFAPLDESTLLKETIGENASLSVIPNAGHAVLAKPDDLQMIKDIIVSLK